MSWTAVEVSSHWFTLCFRYGGVYGTSPSYGARTAERREFYPIGLVFIRAGSGYNFELHFCLQGDWKDDSFKVWGRNVKADKALQETVPTSYLQRGELD